MKIYISGKITGTTDYIERFAAAEEKLTAAGFVTVNPARVNGELPQETTYDEYMAMSLTMLDMCQAIYMLDGWEDSTGASIEFEKACGTKKMIFFESEVMDEIFNQEKAV